MDLARRFFAALCAGEPTKVPQYDKSQFGGEGDRVPEDAWETVNDARPVQVVIFEGWCVGFRSLSAAEVEEKWRAPSRTCESPPLCSFPSPLSVLCPLSFTLSSFARTYRPLLAFIYLHPPDTEKGEKKEKKKKKEKRKSLTLDGATLPASLAHYTVKRHALEHLQLVNSRLAAYDSAVTEHFDAFIHVDAADTEWVYDWRREQEVRLRRERGSGMTDEQVVRFVDAYYPAYELFSDRLRRGLFPADEKPRRQLRLVVGRDRRVQETVVI